MATSNSKLNTKTKTTNKKRKRNSSHLSSYPHLQPRTHSLHPSYTYLSLTLLTPLANPIPLRTLDDTTAAHAILAALTQTHGDFGAAVPVDVLLVGPSDGEVLVRVSVQDGALVAGGAGGLEWCWWAAGGWGVVG
ncbi:hypothetical protein MRB53_037104 [Persea americana]|nr:hypothetical protein MRB53_037104 [Persea americana]